MQTVESFTKELLEITGADTMKELNFDLYAMVSPKTTKDVLVLLEEVMLELEGIQEILDSLNPPHNTSEGV